MLVIFTILQARPLIR